MRRFNVTGACIPKKHYMVDITSKLNDIAEMVDKSSNNQLFLHFLGMLRSKYLDNGAELDVTFNILQFQ